MEESGWEISPVPSGCWVLRGGDLAPASSDKNARAVFEAYGIWGICATAAPDKSADELGTLAPFGNRNMMVVLSDELVAEGFQVIREPGRDWPNALIVVSEGEPVGNDWDRLRVCMIKRGLTANPNYRGK